jgi:hypothetical protein
MITWDDCIKAADEAIEKLAVLINTDALYGTKHQQHMALAMAYKCEASRAEALGMDSQRYSESLERAIWLLSNWRNYKWARECQQHYY